jgi:thiol-disulfide isomerase/thioredoxin
MSKLARNTVTMAIALACFSVFTNASRGEDDAWLTDFAAAKAKAKAENKLMLVDFTGSDWCIWCKRLHADVFDKESFKTDAPKQFVLVELDYPREKKLPKELKAQNDKLKDKYKIRGYPSVLLMDAEGEQVAAIVGYRAGGPEKYVESLAKLVKLHDSVMEMQTELAKAEGLDRAKLLDRMFDATVELGAEGDKTQGWMKEIIALDSDNKAGLKGKYEIRQAMDQFANLMRARKIDDALALARKVQSMPGLTGVQKQDAYYAEATCLRAKSDMAAYMAAMKAALAAAPDGPKAVQIKAFISDMQRIAKLEAEAARLKDELENAEGADRLKALDAVLTAYGKLFNRIGGKDQSADVNKWMQEVIQLDADNKAGLKNKYEYLSLVAEAQKLYISRKPADAQAAIEKALALPGLTQEQISRALLTKCNCLSAQHDYQGAIDCARKARESATGTMGTVFGMAIQNAERALQRQKDGKPLADEPPASNIVPRPGMPLIPLKRLQAADDKSAASDPDHVPSGSIEELLKYAEGLKTAKAPIGYSPESRFTRKTAAVAFEVAEKVLSAKPTAGQTAAALRLKLDALSCSPSFLAYDDLPAKQEELLKQFEKAGLTKEARQTTCLLLDGELGRAAGQKLELAIGKLIDFYRSGPVDKSMISPAVRACRLAEYSGKSELAAKSNRELAKIFAVQEDKQVVEMGAKLAGAGRRLELKETPMLVQGTTMDGQPLDWSKYDGKVVLIDFWATWCGPCRAELPNVRKNYDAYHDRGFEVVGVSLDQKTEDLEKFMEKEKLPWTIVRDDSWNKAKSAPGGDKLVPGYLANYYGVFSIPTMILLGKDGKAITINARGDALTKELEKAFGPVEAKSKDPAVAKSKNPAVAKSKNEENK